jgi:hypothetical protein
MGAGRSGLWSRSWESERRRYHLDRHCQRLRSGRHRHGIASGGKVAYLARASEPGDTFEVVEKCRGSVRAWSAPANRSTPACRPIWRSTSSWTTTARTKRRPCAHGSRSTRAFMCISRRLTRRGSTRSSAGSRVSTPKHCAAARTPASGCSRPIRQYIDSSNTAGTPFVWTKTTDQILASIARFAQRTVQIHGGK